jgi:Fe-S-cluster-containing hydrogenase component 2
MAKRDIVQIDEEKCDGCGLCVPACAEGAIRIVDGKARLVSDVYCDGLGACLGHCPQDAIKIIQRDAVEFDEAAVAQHLADAAGGQQAPAPAACPSSRPQSLQLNVLAQMPEPAGTSGAADTDAGPSPPLANWPIQLHLVPPAALFLQQADLVLAADCVPFACAGFHRQVVQGRPLLIGCPKLDDADFYVKKLAAIFSQANVQRVTVVHMEVPCCTGLLRIAEAARAMTGRDIPFEDVVVSIRGQILQTAEADRT